MAFSFFITPATELTGGTVDEPGEGLDYDSLVMSACAVLAETDCRFTISGFGCAEWPVDVDPDLSTLVEQLPDLVENLCAGRAGEIDLYEQGMERTLHFHPSGGQVLITCTSRTAWTPDPATESIDRRELQTMITRLLSTFSTSLKAAGSPLAEMAPFASWRHTSIHPTRHRHGTG